MLDWGLQGTARFVWICSWSIVPLWLLLTWWSHKKRRSQCKTFGEPRLVYSGVPWLFWRSRQDYRKARSGDKNQAMNLIRQAVRRRQNIKVVLITMALACLIAALGRPQWGMKQEELHQQGVDIVLCVDASESMKAQDVAPSRLDKARSVIATMLSQLSGNRVGLVGFATSTRLHCPLTLDFRGLRSILDHSFSFGPGTNIEAAMDACIRVLKSSDARSRCVILVSDGEDHGGDIDAVISQANALGIHFFTLGVGTLEGGPIPLGNNEEDGYKKSNGELIWTHLEEDTMKKLADETQGRYFRLSNLETEAFALAKEIDNLEKSDFSQTMTTRREEQFGIFLLLAALFLALEMVINSIGPVGWEDANEIIR